MASQLPFDFTGGDLDRGNSEPEFVVDLDGFEGPLDLLIELARRQKIDLQKISILALADQYLAFIEARRRMRLELAADYLVMAAWLAYLKSRLLLPEPPQDDEPAAADLAADFARRLRHLEAIRAAGALLANRPRLGRDFFGRGATESIEAAKGAWDASLYDLLSAYARQRQKQARSNVTFKQRVVWSLADARQVLERLIGRAADWSVLDDFLITYIVAPEMRPTVRASTFSAALEMVREGQLDLRQEAAFAPIWVRSRAARLTPHLTREA